MPHPTQIHTLRIGLTNCYLVRQQGTLLIDTGEPNRLAAFQRKLETLDVDPTDIDLILLTHGHSDHVGCTADIAHLTGAPVAIHQADAPYLAEGKQLPATPVGLWARFLGLLFKFAGSYFHFDPYQPDILLGDKEHLLGDYGINGRIIHTPGHTPGSVSLLLALDPAKPDKVLFVGDLAMNGFPNLSRHPDLAIVIDNRQQLLNSWRRLFNMPISMVYPAHGRPFLMQELHQRVEAELMLQA
jgi:hydroxyacylglutathione hydrolase